MIWCASREPRPHHVLVRRRCGQVPMKRGARSNNRVVENIPGRRKPIAEQSNAYVLAALWPDWNRAPVVAVPPTIYRGLSTTPASISVTVKEMAASVGLSRDMAMKALRVLETETLIICDRPRGRSANQYRICWGTFRWRPPR